MREIKFRAWFNDSNDEDRPEWEMDYSKDSNLSIFFNWLDDEDTHNIMQYTGLKDKNGTEIYEGDILKASRHNNTLDGEIGIVGFLRGCYCLKCPEFESNQHINLCEFGILGNHLEVIGNIYENKELLEGK